MTTYTLYTVFSDKDGEQFWDCDESLESGIEWLVNHGYTPVAWAPGDVRLAVWLEVRAESIAAGRLIDNIDGKFIPRMPEQAEQMFRVGGVYRSGDGYALYGLVPLGETPIPQWICEEYPTAVFAESVSVNRITGAFGKDTYGAHRLSDGRFFACLDGESRHHLLPGELEQINGQWVAKEQGAQLTASEIIAKAIERLAQAPVIFGADLAKGIDWPNTKQPEKQHAPLPKAADPSAIRDEKGAEESARWAALQAEKMAATGKQEQPKLSPAGLCVVAPMSHHLGSAFLR